VLIQPGFDDAWDRSGAVDAINAMGLIDDTAAAVALMNAANKLDYGPLPFCVESISTLEAVFNKG